MREKYATTPNNQLSALLGRKPGTIDRRAAKLGICKDKDWVKATSRESILKAGSGTRFTKGQKSWNEGTKGVMKPNSGNFPKGNTPHNTRQDGDLSARRDSKTKRYYLHRRVAVGVWRMEHVLIWEATHGPVPKGMVIAFKDGNTAHLKIENLELVSRGDLMRRNTIHRLPEDLKEFIRQLMSFNIQLRKVKKKHGKE